MNRRSWLVSFLGCLLIGKTVWADGKSDPESEPPPDPKDELRRWSGTYEVVHFELNGRKYTDAELKTMKVILKQGEGYFHMGTSVFESNLSVRPDRKIREVDAVYGNSHLKGKTVKGIYKIEGDKITICYAGVDQERPKDFKCPPGAGYTMYTARRIKER